MTRFWMVRPVLLVLALAFYFLFSCSDGPLGPEDETPLGYKVYFHDAGDNPKWYIYYPESDYLDSVELPIQAAYKGAISPDGSTMYAKRTVDCGVWVIDLVNSEILHELNEYCRTYLVLSPDGKWLVLGNTSIDVYRTDDMTLIYQDTAPLFQNPFFAPGSDSLYGTYRPGRMEDYYVSAPLTDLADTAVDTLPFDVKKVGAAYLVATPENDKWYLQGLRGYNSVLHHVVLEWDRTSEQTIMIDSIERSYPEPMSRLSADERYLVSTRPGSNWDPDEERPCEFIVYDTELEQIIDVVDTKIITEAGDTIYLNIEEIVLTPDSKYVVGLARDGYNWLAVYNLSETRFERFVEISGNHEFSGLLCQTGL